MFAKCSNEVQIKIDLIKQKKKNISEFCKMKKISRQTKLSNLTKKPFIYCYLTKIRAAVRFNKLEPLKISAFVLEKKLHKYALAAFLTGKP